MCRLIGEYISLELFYFVSFTSSCSLIPYMCLENSAVLVTIGLINMSTCDLFQSMVGCWSCTCYDRSDKHVYLWLISTDGWLLEMCFYGAEHRAPPVCIG